jgi:hypothetical protein
MSDETTPLADPLPTPRSTRPVLDQAEIRAGSVMAILVYTFNFFWPFFWVVPMLMSNDRFALYQAKQEREIEPGLIGSEIAAVAVYDGRALQ